MEVARMYPESIFTGLDIHNRSLEKALENNNRLGLSERVKFLQMDATEMKFPGTEFDNALNYLGLEDIHMTKGRRGVVEKNTENNERLNRADL